jgi:putative ATP-dependent endonuclease of OLD family
VFDKTPGADWIDGDSIRGEMLVRERWVWSAAGRPKREGWHVKNEAWDEKVPWGAPNIANARRPEPHRVDAFASPEAQAREIIKLLQKALTDRVKKLGSGEEGDADAGELSDYGKLLDTVITLQKSIVDDAKTEISAVEKDITSMIGEVFPDHVVTFDARPEDDVEKCINLFKSDPALRMGPKDGYQSPIEKQGSGARRTLLWTALRILSEENRKKAKSPSDRPHVLLMDEPELCLHPDAIREARRVLYDLPRAGNWQVMVTTHSPVFIDLSRDNTTVVRVERRNDGVIEGTTVFRPDRVKLSDDEKQELKMLNACDPHVAEFFFGGRTILVEGDTEYTAFKYLCAENPDDPLLKNVHVVRARGKAIICLIGRILNQFGASYAVLHDSDAPKAMRDGKEIVNSAWSENQKILDVVQLAPKPADVRLVTLVPNFEVALLGKQVRDEKPFNAWSALRRDESICQPVRTLLNGLLDSSLALPEGCIRWKSLEELETAWKKRAPG